MATLSEQLAALNQADLSGLRAKITQIQTEAEKRLAEQSKENWSENAIRQYVVPVLERIGKFNA